MLILIVSTLSLMAVGCYVAIRKHYADLRREEDRRAHLWGVWDGVNSQRKFKEIAPDQTPKDNEIYEDQD